MFPAIAKSDIKSALSLVQSEPTTSLLQVQLCSLNTMQIIAQLYCYLLTLLIIIPYRGNI